MIWTVTMVAMAVIAALYLARKLRAKLVLKDEASAEKRTAKASDLRRLMDRALRSRPPRGADEQ